MNPFFKIMASALFFLGLLTPVQAYQAIIFDCDGVLVDTEHLKFLAWQKALKDIHIDFTEIEYLPLVGESSAKIAIQIKKLKQSSFNEQSLIAKKNAIYSRLQKQGVPRMQGAIDFLNTLIAQKKQRNIQLAIASSAPRLEILENLKQLVIKPTSFDAILSGHDDLQHIKDSEGTNKPKPYIYQLAAQKLGVQPENCLVFEDSAAGVIAAAKAGMTVIAIPNKYTLNHDFSLATKKINHFHEIDINKRY